MDERLGADRDLVAEQGRDLVGVAGAADVAEQRHPVGRLAHLVRRRSAASQIHDASRHERSCDSSGWPNALSCASASVATNSAEAKRSVQDGESSRCIGRAVRDDDHPTPRRLPSIRRAATVTATKGGQHGSNIATGEDPISVGVDRRPDRPALVRRARQRQRRQDGRRRHQRQGRPARPPARAVSRGRRDRRRGRGGRGSEARRAGQGRRHLRRHLQLHAAGDQGPGRRRGQDALHLPRAVRGAGVRPADLLHRPGAGAAGRPVHPVADARDRGEDVLPAVGRLHLAARAERAGPRGRRPPNGGTIVGEEYYPLDHMDYARDGRADHGERRGRRVQHDRAARGDAVLRASSTTSGFTSRGGQLVCTYFDENFLNMVPAAHVEGLYGCLDYYQAVDDPFSQKLLAQYDALLSRRREVHRRQRLLRPLPRAPALGRGRDGGRLARRRRT